MPLPPNTLNQALDQLPQLLLSLGRLQQDRRDEELRRDIQQASQRFQAELLTKRIAAEKELTEFKAGLEAPPEPRIIEDVAGRKRFAPAEGQPGELVFPDVEVPTKVSPETKAATTKVHAEALRRWRNLRAEKSAYESKLKTYTTLVGTPEGIVSRIIEVKWVGTNKPQQLETAKKAVVKHGGYDPETFELKLLDESIQQGISPTSAVAQPTQVTAPSQSTIAEQPQLQSGLPFEPTVAATTGQTISVPDYENSDTGERIRWDGSKWIEIE